MPEYKTPGVYVEEVERGPKPIEGVSTSVAGFVGVTERGPTEPQLITSFAEYTRQYGGYATSPEWTNYAGNDYMAYALDGFFTNGGQRAWVTRVVPTDWITNERFASEDLTDDSDDTVMTVSAKGVGLWGRNVAVDVEPASSGDPDRFKLRIGYWRDPDDLTGKDWDTLVQPANEGLPDHDEVYDELSTESTDSNYYMNVVDGASDLVTIEPGTSTDKPSDDTTVLDLPVAVSTMNTAMSGSDYEGVLDKANDRRSGLAAFEDVDEITMVAVPDEHHKDVGGDLIDHCERMADRIAIVQSTQNADLTGLPSGRASEYAAFYYPWLTVRDPETDLERAVPPCGHVAGIYARSDAQRGVHKAPANENVRGVQGLTRTINKAEQASLNPAGVNCIRSFRGRGIRVWGARTTSSDPEWKYVNVRRLFLFLEESIEEGTQWVVFEPNDETLWARVRQTIGNFLLNQWAEGALMGNSPEEAYYVKCDRTTMTQNDIDNGRLICEIGVAPVKPAEFVVFRISQWTAGAGGGS